MKLLGWLAIGMNGMGSAAFLAAAIISKSTWYG